MGKVATRALGNLGNFGNLSPFLSQNGESTQTGSSMSRELKTSLVLCVTALCLTGLGAWHAFHAFAGSVADGSRTSSGLDNNVLAAAPTLPTSSLEHRFTTRVQPFLERYCISCHGPKKQKGMLDLSRDATV